MTLVRWDPFSNIVSMQDRMNRVLGDLTRVTTGEDASWRLGSSG